MNGAKKPVFLLMLLLRRFRKWLKSTFLFKQVKRFKKLSFIITALLGTGLFLSRLESIQKVFPYVQEWYLRLAMKHLPGGTFTLGRSGTSDNEAPAHKVVLSDFYVDRHEITVREYVKFCRATTRELPPDPCFPNMPQYYLDKRWQNFPAVNVSWYDADEYCRWKKKALLTEAQWERASRYWNGIDHISPFVNSSGVALGNGADKSLKAFFPNYDTPQGSPTDTYAFVAPVRKTIDIGNGISGLEGNAAEWCRDTYDDFYFSCSPEKDPCNTELKSVTASVRGPSWASSSYSVTTRNHFSKSEKSYRIGFRCASCSGQ